MKIEDYSVVTLESGLTVTMKAGKLMLTREVMWATPEKIILSVDDLQSIINIVNCKSLVNNVVYNEVGKSKSRKKQQINLPHGLRGY